MFSNLTSKLKLSAWIVMGIGVVSSIFGGVVCFVVGGQINQLYGLYSDFSDLFGSGYGSRSSGAGAVFIICGVFIILFGCFLSYVVALLINGYARIVDNTAILAGTQEEPPKPVAPLTYDRFDGQYVQGYYTPGQDQGQGQTSVTQTPSTVKFCPQCGSPNELDYMFCQKCGNKLD